MADLESLYENFVDFQLEEDEDFDEDFLNQYSEYEDTEIVVPDDLNFDDLEDAEDSYLDDLPLINFSTTSNQTTITHNIVESVDETSTTNRPENVDHDIVTTSSTAHNEIPGGSTAETCEVGSSTMTQQTDQQPESNKPQPKVVGFQCPKCLKPYVREHYYLEHVKICKRKVNAGIGRRTVASMKKAKTSDTVYTIDHELVESASNMILETLSEISNDPINNRITKKPNYGNMIRDLSKTIKIYFTSNQQSLRSKGENLLKFLDKEIYNTNFSKTPSREEFWSHIMEKLQSQDLMKDWEEILSQIPNQNEKQVVSGFFYSLTTIFIKLILSYKSDKADNDVSKPDIKLTDEEQQVVYYVSGFIGHSLRKKYNKLCAANSTNVSAMTALKFCETLEKSDVQGKRFLDYVRDWVRVKDRGGLIKVNDTMFLMIRRIEYIVRETLNVPFLKKYRGEDLRSKLFNQIKKNSTVNLYWDSLTKDLSNVKLKIVLKEQIIFKWIDIRAKSFVTCYILALRRKLNKLTKEEKEKKTQVEISKKGEVALRKGLK